MSENIDGGKYGSPPELMPFDEESFLDGRRSDGSINWGLLALMSKTDDLAKMICGASTSNLKRFLSVMEGRYTPDNSEESIIVLAHGAIKAAETELAHRAMGTEQENRQ
jgi:hypothetical protein